MKRLRLAHRQAVEADASALLRAGAADAPAEARRRIAAAAERRDLAAIGHWTGVWYALMRVRDERRRAA